MHDARVRPAVTLQAKLAHLSRATSYSEDTAAVEVVETHMSFVFLTARHAYKMKKPVRYAYLDFGTLEARRIDCLEEVRLNRRLAAPVYLGVVPLAASPDGALALEGTGKPVEWLVKMRRLPRDRMLDQAIADRTATDADIVRFATALADFYRGCAPVPMAPAEYRARLAREIEARRAELLRPEYGLPEAAIAWSAGQQLRFLRERADLLDARVGSGRIVEGHGDLRPEHVCLGEPPLVIDCLEFNRDLRLLDCADELAYLALECTYAGAPQVGERVLAVYCGRTADQVPAVLFAFYQSCRALLRAQLAAWHLHDLSDPAAQQRWLRRADRYVAYAVEYAEKLDAVSPFSGR